MHYRQCLIISPFIPSADVGGRADPQGRPTKSFAYFETRVSGVATACIAGDFCGESSLKFADGSQTVKFVNIIVIIFSFESFLLCIIHS